MSTAFLPKAKIVPFGYPTGMDRAKWVEWARRRLKATGLSESRASKMAGHPDSLRNLRLGKAKPKIETLRALVKVLGEPPAELEDAPLGEGVPTLAELRAQLVIAKQTVQDIETTISTLESLRKKTG